MPPLQPFGQNDAGAQEGGGIHRHHPQQHFGGDLVDRHRHQQGGGAQVEGEQPGELEGPGGDGAGALVPLPDSGLRIRLPETVEENLAFLRAWGWLSRYWARTSTTTPARARPQLNPR